MKSNRLRDKTIVEKEATLPGSITVDKEKVKKAYSNDIVSLEIMRVPATANLKTTDEAEAYYNERVNHKMYLIDDLDDNYIIRLSYTEKKQELKSVDPDHLQDADQYELSETIQEILRENLFPVIESNFPKQEKEPISPAKINEKAINNEDY